MISLAGSGASVQAATHGQSDWSGGPAGALGPVSTWGDQFANTTQTSWLSIPGQLALSSTPMGAQTGFITSTAPSCRSVASGDLDGDGDVDVMTALPLTSFPGTGKVRWYENAGDGITWTEHEIDDDFYGGWGITAGDIDGDGDLDVVASAFYGNPDRNGRWVWYENLDGAAGSWAKHAISTGNFYGTQMAAAADLDGDGDLDVYGCSTLTYLGSENDDVYWFENTAGDGSAWVQHRVDTDYRDAIEVAAADIDKDGDLDLVGTSYGIESIVWWENVDGDGIQWTRRTVTPFTPTNNAVAVADLDDDGDLDVVAAGVNAVAVAWYENIDGFGLSWAAHGLGQIPGASDVAIADLDGDGELDILASSPDLDFSFTVWFRNQGGAAGFTLFLIEQGHDNSEAAIAADLDGDGSLEVVYTEEGAFQGDISGLHRASITAFRTSGELVSSVLDAGDATTWTTIDWDAAVPPSTSLVFQVRSGNDAGDLGPWSSDIESPGSLAGILAPDTRYAQYRVIAASSDPAVSPILYGMSVDEGSAASTPDGEGSPFPTTVSFQNLWPNPTSGSSTALFALPSTARTRLEIIDPAGRRLATPLSEVLEAGSHQVALPELPAGVYLVRLRSGSESTVRKLVVR
ncbi:MAG: T9SS type A sorting domain-containing protein [Candidatus Eisenbacteria bacterium]|uniref:T9SS type A sorting domain-containing protein n=1 Tax=Eiseniibacteriota bacterium TaxID=2212470 RepID=A0A956LVM3_UNCEI|nr:T9SS type A sorting domain-containing protein [Candidatus Eisenbacteria bacterium]